MAKSVIVGACIFLCLCLANQASARYLQVCGQNIADVIFIIDASDSIYRHDFEHQLKWINDVIDEFDIGQDRMRVGAVSFSNWAFLEFNLNQFFSKHELKRAISHVAHSRGDTNTAAALTYVKDTMFSRDAGSRFSVPKVAIVLTDGESNDPKATSYIAEAARIMGIQIFAIGIGHKVNEDELRSIASQPLEQYMFRVDDYAALQSIKQTVAAKACEVTTPNPTTPIPTERPSVIGACGSHAIADIVLATSPRGSDFNTEKSLEFFRQLSLGMDIADDKIHVGLVPKDCRDIPEINLETYAKKDEALKALDKLSDQVQADTSDILRYMRKTSFNPSYGARHNAKKIAVLVVDDTSASLDHAVKEAQKLKQRKGVEIFVIGVGRQVDPSHLRQIVTEPSETHVFHVSDYNGLQNIISNVQQVICAAPLN